MTARKICSRRPGSRRSKRGMADIAEIDTSELGTAKQALERVQNFDTGTLVREDELGKRYAMHEAVEPAKRIIDLFKLISLSQMSCFEPVQLIQIKANSDAFYSLLREVLEYDVEEASPSPSEAKDALVERLVAQKQPIFDALHPLISFASVRSLDFAKLERDARAATQAASDQARQITQLLTD